MAIYAKIKKQIDQLDTGQLSAERKEILNQLVIVIQEEIDTQQDLINLNFICTHNSRRSIFAQTWFQALASFYGFHNLKSYSGGTEQTAIYPEVLTTLKKQGFVIEILQHAKNPIYDISYSDLEEPIIGFSKTYSNSYNPGSQYIAVMVCDQALEACPIVKGAKKRIGITYQDPKIYDSKPQKENAYLDCSKQIATEMKWVISQLNTKGV